MIDIANDPNEQLRKELTNNMQKRPNRTQQKIKTILTRLRLIEHPAARVNRARKRIRALLEKDLQRRKEEAAKRAEDESIRQVKQDRGDRPCANTRNTSTQVVNGATTNTGKDNQKEPRWSGGTTHVRSKISEQMVRLMQELESRARGDG